MTTILNAACAPQSDVSRHYLDRIVVENADDVIHVLLFNGEFIISVDIMPEDSGVRPGRAGRQYTVHNLPPQ